MGSRQRMRRVPRSFGRRSTIGRDRRCSDLDQHHGALTSAVVDAHRSPSAPHDPRQWRYTRIMGSLRTTGRALKWTPCVIFSRPSSGSPRTRRPPVSRSAPCRCSMQELELDATGGRRREGHPARPSARSCRAPLDALGLAMRTHSPGLEADDVIASAATWACRKSWKLHHHHVRPRRRPLTSANHTQALRLIDAGMTALPSSAPPATGRHVRCRR